MTQSRHEFVVSLPSRALLLTLFVLCVLFGAWFLVVLYGETQGWTDDPGRWAGVPTSLWAFVGLALFAFLIVYALTLLVIRESPGRIYRIEEGPGAKEASTPPTPSFLQPAEGRTPPPSHP